MIFSLLTALALNANTLTATPAARTAVSTAASYAACLREKAETARKLPTVAKLNGTISSVSSKNIVVNGTTVNLLSNTVLLRKFGGKSTLTELSVGDEVQVLGKWTDSTNTAVNARVIRDLSVQKRRGTFVGTAVSVTPAGFSFQPLSRPPQTVTISPNTKFVDRKMKALTFSSITAGHKIMVRGLWDSKLNTITEVVLVKDFSLPVIVTPATPSAAIRN